MSDEYCAMVWRLYILLHTPEGREYNAGGGQGWVQD